MLQDNPLICAIDTSNLSDACALINDIAPYVGKVKLGLEFFSACGPEGVQRIVDMGVGVFLDLKFHDIPNTVAGAVSAVTALGVDMITVHSSGGAAMLEAASRAADDAAIKIGKNKPIILAITLLTSLDEDDLKQQAIAGTSEDHVNRLTAIGIENGVGGIVCSAQELESLKKIYHNDTIFVVPGIRPVGSNQGDQKRIMTPKQAIDKGANYIVVGRPITQADNPALAAQAIMEEIQE